jgi:hypothetical protein
MRRKEILPLKTPRDKIYRHGDKFYPEWEVNVKAITGHACSDYMEKLQWLDENPRSEFRIDNGHGERDINHWYRPTKQVRIENGENVK